MGNIKQTINTVETKDKYGHVLEITTNTKTVSVGRSTEPNFCKFYTDKLDLLDNVKDSSLRLLIHLLPYVDYADVTDLSGGQLIRLDKKAKEEITQKMKTSERTFFRSLKDLIENKIIKKIDSINYQINPFLVGCGFWIYKENYHSGGIGDLRNAWNEADGKRVVEKRYVVEDSAILRTGLRVELEEAYKAFKKAVEKKDIVEADYCKERINEYTHSLKELDVEEYTKFVKYAVEVNKIDLENLDADIDEEKELDNENVKQEPEPIKFVIMSDDLIPPEPPEGFGMSDDDPFLLFAENSV